MLEEGQALLEIFVRTSVLLCKRKHSRREWPAQLLTPNHVSFQMRFIKHQMFLVTTMCVRDLVG